MTNDDGINSVGLHRLAQAMRPHGEVVVVAPDREFSGASSAIGAIWDFEPHITRATIEGIDEVWTVNGPPALCVLYASLGLFDEPFDLVVSGINPGANVGRSVYYSGTVGACLAARNAGWSGVAVSQATDGWAGIDGQVWSDVLRNQRWDAAVVAADAFVGALVKEMPTDPVVVNLNVPNLDPEEIVGWRRTEVGDLPPWALTKAHLVDKADHEGCYGVQIDWGEKLPLPPDTDGGTVNEGCVSVTYLSRLDADHRTDLAAPEQALSNRFGL